jgi:hypothetical protein
MSAKPDLCPSCGAPLVTQADGSCRACGVDPFLVEVVGKKQALADALASHLDDLQAFVGRLAAMLEEGFTEHTEIKKSGVFSKHVAEIAVSLKTHVYRLVVHGKHATGHRSRHVRGVKLKEETLAMADWLQALSADLEAVAAESQHARDALARFVK